MSRGEEDEGKGGVKRPVRSNVSVLLNECIIVLNLLIYIYGKRSEGVKKNNVSSSVYTKLTQCKLTLQSLISQLLQNRHMDRFSHPSVPIITVIFVLSLSFLPSSVSCYSLIYSQIDRKLF